MRDEDGRSWCYGIVTWTDEDGAIVPIHEIDGKEVCYCRNFKCLRLANIIHGKKIQARRIFSLFLLSDLMVPTNLLFLKVFQALLERRSLNGRPFSGTSLRHVQPFQRWRRQVCLELDDDLLFLVLPFLDHSFSC
jgi:hypothetical protein